MSIIYLTQYFFIIFNFSSNRNEEEIKSIFNYLIENISKIDIDFSKLNINKIIQYKNREEFIYEEDFLNLIDFINYFKKVSSLKINLYGYLNKNNK